MRKQHLTHPFRERDHVLVTTHGRTPRKAVVSSIEGQTARVLYDDSGLHHRVRIKDLAFDGQIPPGRMPQEGKKPVEEPPKSNVVAMSGVKTAQMQLPAPPQEPKEATVTQPDPPKPPERPKPRMTEWIYKLYEAQNVSWKVIAGHFGMSEGRLRQIQKGFTLAQDDELLKIAEYMDKTTGSEWIEQLMAMREADAAAGVKPLQRIVKPGRKVGVSRTSVPPKSAPPEQAPPEPGQQTLAVQAAFAPKVEPEKPKDITVKANGIELSGDPEAIRKLLGL